MARWTDLLFGWAMRDPRRDRRFVQVTAALGLERYWRAAGVRADYRT